MGVQFGSHFQSTFTVVQLLRNKASNAAILISFKRRPSAVSAQVIGSAAAGSWGKAGCCAGKSRDGVFANGRYKTFTVDRNGGHRNVGAKRAGGRVYRGQG